MPILRLFRDAGPDTEHAFTIESTRPLSAEERRRVLWLCAETFTPDGTHDESRLADAVEVGPRLTIETPFSSNAVAICHAMGLDAITRIETSRRGGAPSLDRMTETRWPRVVTGLSEPATPAPVTHVGLLTEGRAALERLNRTMGLGMDVWDLDFYTDLFVRVFRRDPTDVELFQLGQSNSEHSRHWYFKGVHTIDGVDAPETLFAIVQAPLAALGPDIASLIAFRDNGGAIRGGRVTALQPAHQDRSSPMRLVVRDEAIVCTAETHNHPTLVSPFPGAATGIGGMLRDLSAVGRGSIAGASVAGYFVGALAGHEGPAKNPAHASPLSILIDGSNGVSAYANEIGIPTILGFTRSFGQEVAGEWCEARKPVLYCGGIGTIDVAHLDKQPPAPGLVIVGLGGPAFPIGVGGGGASSMQGANDDALDFKSVQRGNPEMENRVLRVIRACSELGAANPIASLHDQGAGGPGNLIPELVEPLGGRVDIRAIKVGDASMSVLEIWSGEYQERFGLLARPDGLAVLQAICARERVTCETLGTVTGDGRIVVEDSRDGSRPVDLALAPILTAIPQKRFVSQRQPRSLAPLRLPADLTVADALARVFALPQVGSKGFLIHKADRCVTGLVARQQGVGPLGLPLSNVAVRAASFFGHDGMPPAGTAMAVGEQPIKMLADPAAGARMAVGEMLTNMASARIGARADLRCRANWMWAAKEPGEGPRLRDAAIAMRDIMLALGIAIDGGKDSLSMATQAGDTIVKTPGTLVILGYAAVPDVTRVMTPDLKRPGDSVLVLIDLGHNRLGASSLAQAYGQVGADPPDVDDPAALRAAFDLVQDLIARDMILSLHDRSDGGLITAVIEMAMAAHAGLDLAIHCDDPIAALFAEELGFVIEIAPEHEAAVVQRCAASGLAIVELGRTRREPRVTLTHNGAPILESTTDALLAQWSATSLRLEEQQTAAGCVAQERAATAAPRVPLYRLAFDPVPTTPALLSRSDKPKVAVLREEGSNADREMAAALFAAGLEPWDVAMSDLIAGRITLDGFRAVTFCGGFSFMDVFGSGKGWAGTIRFNDTLRDMFDAFYARADTLSLGACNGCQLMALLGWVPFRGIGDAQQPRFIHNASGRFESRWSRVVVQPSATVHLAGMEGSVLGIWTEHGEGRLIFPDGTLRRGAVIPLAYVDPDGAPTDAYPFNPNGSASGACALASPDGRHLAIMPHPERSFLPWQCEWMPPEWRHLQVSPWLRLFQNMRAWLDDNRQP